MKSKTSRNLDIDVSFEAKKPQIKKVYTKLKKNFDEEAGKIKLNLSKPLFDDQMLSTVHKTLPKLQIQAKKKIERKKFYSNKLIVNESVYIHERSEISHYGSFSRLKKIVNPFQDDCILSQRSKRLLRLFKRASLNTSLEREEIKILDQKQCQQIQTELIEPKQSEEKNCEQNNDEDKRVLEALKVTNERQTVRLPQVRAKSNMIINSIQPLTPKTVIKGQNPSNSKDLSKKKRSLKKEPLASYSSVPYKGIKFIKKVFNWKTAPFPVDKISKSQFLSLIQSYLNINEVKPIALGYYKAYIGQGNNCNLIKKTLKERGHWCFVESLDDDPHFVWTQQKCMRFFNKLQSNQNQSYKSKKVEKSQIQEDEIMEIENFIKIKMNDFISGCEKLLTKRNFYKLMNELMKKFKSGKNISWYAKIKHLVFNVYNDVKYETQENIQSGSTRLHNHVENSSAIGNKKGLFFYIKNYAQLFSQNVNNLIPETVHVKDEQGIIELLSAIPEGPWIVKPGQSTNRGQGITIHTNQQSLVAQISKKKKHKRGIQYTYIVQKYIEPLLYHGRKFDIRVWVLWNGRQAWWYRQGYIRTSSRQYNIKNTNKYIHLTNDAIQSQLEDFGKYEPANKLSYNEFQKYLDIQFGYKRFHEGLEQQMKEITEKVFRIANMVMDQKNKKYTFELFGMDFLIDKNFKAWLIECNTNPSLEVNCSLLARLVPNMVDNMMSLAVDPYFGVPEKKLTKDISFWNQDNFKFQLMYDGNQDIELKEKSLLSTQVSYEFEESGTDD